MGRAGDDRFFQHLSPCAAVLKTLRALRLCVRLLAMELKPRAEAQRARRTSNGRRWSTCDHLFNTSRGEGGLRRVSVRIVVGRACRAGPELPQTLILGIFGSKDDQCRSARGTYFCDAHPIADQGVWSD
jgi:hypothetical protein